MVFTLLIFVCALSLLSGQVLAQTPDGKALICKAAARYEAGKDVRGKALAPADLSPEEGGTAGAIPFEGVIRFPLQIDTLAWLGMDLPGLEGQTEVVSGMVEIDLKSGMIMIGGRNYTAQALEACHAQETEERE